MKHRIVVLGAGYAGAIAAGRLARRLHPDGEPAGDVQGVHFHFSRATPGDEPQWWREPSRLCANTVARTAICVP